MSRGPAGGRLRRGIGIGTIAVLTILAVLPGTATGVLAAVAQPTVEDSGTGSPQAVAGDDQVVAAGELTSFDAGSSTPAVGIASYHWALGDGSEADTIEVGHSYATPGVYTATLTVTTPDAATATDSVVIDVREPPTTPGVQVTAVDGVGAAIAGAQVAVIDAEARRFLATTGPDGLGTLHHLSDGTYSVYAWRDGFLPQVATVAVVGGSGSATIALAPAEVAVTPTDSQALSPEEIADLWPGDDVIEADRFSVGLGRSGESFVLTAHAVREEEGGWALRDLQYTGSGAPGEAGCGCWTAGGTTFSPTIAGPSGAPILSWVLTSRGGGWQREPYGAGLVVQPLGGSPALGAGIAVLRLPLGTSFASTPAGQRAVALVGDVAPGGSTQVHWTVRGDVEGTRLLAVDYAVDPAPEGTTIVLRAEAAVGVRIWGPSALRLIIDQDAVATARTPFVVRAHLENTAEVPAHNAAVQLITDDRTEYTLQPNQPIDHRLASVAPGATVTTPDVVLVPLRTGALDLSHAFALRAAGSVAPQTSIVTHPATPRVEVPQLLAARVGSSTELQWDPVAGAVGYEVRASRDPLALYDTASLATVGGDATSVVVPGGTSDQLWALSSVLPGGIVLRHPVAPATETAGALAVADVAVTEGDSGSRDLQFDVVLTRAAIEPVTVKVTVADQTARAAAGDYGALAPQTIRFEPGTTTVPVVVAVAGDTLHEGNETLKLTLSAPKGAALADPVAIGTILDEEGLPTIAAGDTSVIEGHDGVTRMTWTVSRVGTPDPTREVTVVASVTGRTATAGVDYASVPPSTLVFGPDGVATVSVDVQGDAIAEPTESVLLKLTAPKGAVVVDAAATGSIVNDDGVASPTVPVSLTVDDLTGLEGDTGLHDAPVTLRLSGPAPAAVSVLVQTVDLTASAGGHDYLARSATVTFPEGTTTAVFPVSVVGDLAPEGNETFRVQLSKPVGATIADTTANVTLVDEEGPRSIQIADVVATQEADRGTYLTFVLRLSLPSEVPVTVHASTADGTAKVTTGDYTAVTGTVTFDPGRTVVAMPVLVAPGPVGEPAETLTLKLTAPAGAALGDTVATGTIQPTIAPPPVVDPNQPHNIVFLVTDDQNYDTLPAMRRLMAFPGGSWVNFTSAYANDSICCPARATFMTGQFAHDHGVLNNESGQFLDDTSTLPVWLQAAGYRTGLIGKYLNAFPWGRRAEDGGPYIPPGWDVFMRSPKGSDGGARGDTDVALRFIQESGTGPYFLYLSYRDPHLPATPEPQYADAEVFVPPLPPNYNEADMSDKPSLIRSSPLKTPAQTAAMEVDRLGTQRELLSVDDQIQRIVDTLQSSGQLERTVIVVVSDNGYSWGSHRFFKKPCVYEECTHVPLLIRYPGASANTTVDSIVGHVDILPTLAEIAGVTPGRPPAGHSLMPFLAGDGAPSWPQEQLLEAHAVGPKGTFYGLRTDRWKYAEYGTGERELYDLAVDPYEMENLAKRADHAAVVAELSDRVAALKAG